MKIKTWMWAVAAGVGAVVAGLAALPGQLQVSRSAVVRGTPEQVVHYVSHFPDRLAWVPWSEVDPGADYTFGGTPTVPGATMSWTGEEIGQATLTLHSVAPDRVESELAYVAPFQMTTHDVFELEALPDGRTRVTWSATGALPFGPGRVFGLFADQIMGPDYVRGLEKLDALLAQQS